MWDKRIWDLKRLGQKNPVPNPKTIRDNIKHGLKQIRYNRYTEKPGGLIIDIKPLQHFTVEDVKGIVMKSVDEFKPDYSFVVIIKSGNEIRDISKIQKK